jgi:hypothetical protein
MIRSKITLTSPLLSPPRTQTFTYAAILKLTKTVLPPLQNILHFTNWLFLELGITLCNLISNQNIDDAATARGNDRTYIPAAAWHRCVSISSQPEKSIISSVLETISFLVILKYALE